MAGFGNPPVPWREMHRRLSGAGSESDPLEPAPDAHPHPGGGPAHAFSSPKSTASPRDTVPYAELHAHSHYSFLDGASSPAELFHTAAHLGLDGIALTDHNGLYGAAEFAQAAARAGSVDAPSTPPVTVYGAELTLDFPSPRTGAADPGGTHLVVLAEGAEGYHALSRALTDAHLRGSEKDAPAMPFEELAAYGADHWMILTGCRKGALQRAYDGASTRPEQRDAAAAVLQTLIHTFGRDRVSVELTDHGHPGDDVRNVVFAELARAAGVPAVVTGGVHAATRAGTELAEAAAAIRARRSLTELDPYLPATGRSHLVSGATMLHRHARTPDAVTRTSDVARQLAFPLQAAKPQLPQLAVPEGHTQMSWLRALVWEGAAQRYPGIPDRVRERLERELSVIAEKGFSGYFLIVHDLVREARSRGILCQGRGSAANSAVCYTLGITAVDSIFYQLPFERFLSSMREEEPDIDVDFDAARREEIIQYVYETYGRRNAAQVANVITYRPKAAVRDAAKALGYSTGQQRSFTKSLEHRSTLADPALPLPKDVRDLATRLLSTPRHLGIHSGGMVITDRPVSDVCPIQPARKTGRTVLQWDKESCASMGLVKFDLLSLGMLNALQQCFDLVAEHLDESWDLDTIPKEEPGVYDMLCRGDAIGVFQVESRAQLNTLPRLLPRRFTDLVIEIALIRPGPVQGGAVHPYLRRRAGEEPVTYVHPALQPVLERTLGVPLFQEQLMQMAMAVGGCTAEDADLLRRAMGSKRGIERIDQLKRTLFSGMAENGITGAAAEATYAQIEAFAGFGFAESHSISFALIVYASSWIKLHYPAAFLAGLLRAQPMGFYAPRTLTADARRHGVTVLSPSITRSGVSPNLEALTADPASPSPAPGGMDQCVHPHQPAPGPFDHDAPDHTAHHRRDGGYGVRLGLASIRGIDTATATRIVTARTERPFADMDDLARRAGLRRNTLEALARSGALADFGLSRRDALWNAEPASRQRTDVLPHTAVSVQLPLLPVLTDIEQATLDLWSTGIPSDADAHPLSFLRDVLDAQRVTRSDLLATVAPDTLVTVAGLVTHRQRPGTAGGITFVTLEDERGTVNVVIWPRVWERNRIILRTSAALRIRGRLERTREGIVHIIAQFAEPLAAPDTITARDFH